MCQMSLLWAWRFSLDTLLDSRQRNINIQFAFEGRTVNSVFFNPLRVSLTRFPFSRAGALSS